MTARQGSPAAAAEMLVRLLVESAPALLRAGVTSLSITPDGGLSATLAAPPTTTELPKPEGVPTSTMDPLNDASSYPGGRKPGFTRPKDA